MKAQIDVIKVSPEPLVRHGLVKMLTTGSAIPHRVAAALVLDQFGKVEFHGEHPLESRADDLDGIPSMIILLAIPNQIQTTLILRFILILLKFILQA